MFQWKLRPKAHYSVGNPWWEYLTEIKSRVVEKSYDWDGCLHSFLESVTLLGSSEELRHSQWEFPLNYCRWHAAAPCLCLCIGNLVSEAYCPRSVIGIAALGEGTRTFCTLALSIVDTLYNARMPITIHIQPIPLPHPIIQKPKYLIRFRQVGSFECLQMQSDI